MSTRKAVEFFADGGEPRTVTDINGRGTLGVSLDQQFLDELGISQGDDVGIKTRQEDNVIEVHLGSQRE